MARKPLRPLIRSGGFYPSRKWTPLVYAGGYTTANGGEEPTPPPIEKTVTGNPIHILDALAKPAQSLSVKLEPIQDLHGYDNPWPAGGGKNKLNLDTNVTVLSGSVPPAVTISSGEGSATITETYYDRNANKFGWAFNVESNQTYAVSGNITSSNTIVIKIYATDGSVVYTYNLSSSATTFSLSFNSGTNTTLYFYASISLWGQTITLTNVQIEKGTATTYSPYSNVCPISGHTDADVIVSPTLNQSDGTTYPIPLGQTVYGGTLDVTTGVLTVDRAMVDAGTLNWNYSGDSSNHRFSANMPSNYKIPTLATDRANIVCSSYASNPSVVANNDALGISGYQGTSTMFIRDLAFSDATSFNASMPGVQIVYELATPQTIQLTPTQVELLLGENNLFSDGEMTLVYLADGNASEIEALNILLGNRYYNNHEADEPSDREALDILLGNTR